MTFIRPRTIAARSCRSFLVVAILFGIAICAPAMSPRSQVPGQDGAGGGGATAQPSTPAPAVDIGEKVYNVGGSIQPPVAIHTPDPKFSKEARKAKFSGDVTVAMIVDSNGRPRNVHVIRSAGLGLDEKSIEAVKRYKFQPATLNGKPIAVYVNVQVNFRYIP